MSINRILSLSILVAIFMSCEKAPDRIKLQRYRVAGERLYEQHCANCHQDMGQGFKKLYPPINGEELLNNLNRIICVVKQGSNDSLVIDGTQYILPMPASGLSDLEIAEIVTYMRNSWGNTMGLTEVNSIKKTIDNCSKSP